MQGVNIYWQELSAVEIAQGLHRTVIGGLWDELGPAQLSFLKSMGLQPSHKLLDAGCGSLRGGVHLIPYLDPGNYYGSDINRSLLEGGVFELQQLGLMDRQPRLLETAAFEHSQFGVEFEFALAVSLFTHLFANHISVCLLETARVLKRNAAFYATIFEAPHPLHVEPIEQTPGGVVTSFLRDPFHYSMQEMEAWAHSAGLYLEGQVPFPNPRGQKMLRFTKA